MYKFIGPSGTRVRIQRKVFRLYDFSRYTKRHPKDNAYIRVVRPRQTFSNNVVPLGLWKFGSESR